MSNTSPSRINKEQLEKVLIALVLIPVLIMKILVKDKEYSGIFIVIHMLAFSGLLFLYLKEIKKHTYWSWLLGALFIYAISLACLLLDFPRSLPNILSTLVFTIAGVIILYQSIKRSIEYKSFESLGFLLGLFLAILPFLSFFLGKIYEGFPLLNNFGIAFIIGTIMYSENLWDQYEKAQQRFIMMTLLISLTHIIVLASKQL